MCWSLFLSYLEEGHLIKNQKKVYTIEYDNLLQNASFCLSRTKHGEKVTNITGAFALYYHMLSLHK